MESAFKFSAGRAMVLAIALFLAGEKLRSVHHQVGYGDIVLRYSLACQAFAHIKNSRLFGAQSIAHALLKFAAEKRIGELNCKPSCAA